MQMTEAERREWFESPVTQLFLGELRTRRFQATQDWAAQSFFDAEDTEKSSRLNLYALAGVDILDQVITMVEEHRPQNGEV